MRGGRDGQRLARRTRLRVTYATSELPSERRKQTLCASQVDDSRESAATRAAALTAAAKASGGQGASSAAAARPARPAAEAARRHFGRHAAAEKPLATIGGCGDGWGRRAAWLYCMAVLLAGWFGVTAFVLVALPQHTAKSGLSTDEWWWQVASATGFGLLHSFLVLDVVKVLALFITGPYVLMRLPEGRMRVIVRTCSKGFHKGLAVVVG